MSDKIQVFTAMVSICSAIFSGMTVSILISISQQANKRADEAAGKVEEVKSALKFSTDKLAKESTLQELKDKS